MSGFEALLRRERAITAGAILVLAGLAWAYIWSGAGMGMSALDMTTVAPLLLLYGRVLRQRVAEPRPEYAAPIVLAAGYLAAWLAFSIAASSMQLALQRAGLVSATLMRSQSAVLSAAVLLAAGLYQLSPLKRACLKRCRTPVEFLVSHWRPGWDGAFVIGLQHGAWCIGCCWMLMALLFVGGVMNLVWVALLALLVLLEKIAPAGVLASRLAGILLIIWGAATVWVAR